MKVYDYIIELERPNYVLVDMISRFMLMISIAVFPYAMYLMKPFEWNRYTISLVLLTAGMIGWLIRCYRIQRKSDVVLYRIGLLMATAGWLVLNGPVWLISLYALAVLLEKQVKFPQEIAFDEKEIVINSLPKKVYQWNQLNNVLLKDGILTLDFKNNKLIQKNIESESSDTAEQEFNEFCRNRLKPVS